MNADLKAVEPYFDDFQTNKRWGSLVFTFKAGKLAGIEVKILTQVADFTTTGMNLPKFYAEGVPKA